MIKNIIIITLSILCNLVYAQDPKTYIHPRAVQYIPTVIEETQKYMPDYKEMAYIPSLIEHESCISLKHSRCWSPSSELKTAREQGLGLGQVTRTWRPDGTVRFDVLTELKQKYKDDLREASWTNLKQRPDLQIRIMVLMVRDLYKGLYAIQDQQVRYHFVDAAYNGGLGGVQKERRICGLAKDCDPQYWFKQTERYCSKSTKPLYGQRSACDINRHHVSDVFFTRLPKFQKYIFGITKS